VWSLKIKNTAVSGDRFKIVCSNRKQIDVIMLYLLFEYFIIILFRKTLGTICLKPIYDVYIKLSLNRENMNKNMINDRIRGNDYKEIRRYTDTTP